MREHYIKQHRILIKKIKLVLIKLKMEGSHKIRELVYIIKEVEISHHKIVTNNNIKHQAKIINIPIYS